MLQRRYAVLARDQLVDLEASGLVGHDRGRRLEALCRLTHPVQLDTGQDVSDKIGHASGDARRLNCDQRTAARHRQHQENEDEYGRPKASSRASHRSLQHVGSPAWSGESMQRPTPCQVALIQ